MGSKKDISQAKLMLARLRKQPLPVKIALGAVLAFLALATLRFSIKDDLYFFSISEAVHGAGLLALLYKLFALETCSGLSLKTQELTALAIVTETVCNYHYSIYTLLNGVSLVATLGVIWVMRTKLKSTYIKEFDNLPIHYVVGPCAILALIIYPYQSHWGRLSVVWAFSTYLKAVSVVPQLHFMQNAKVIEAFTGYYVFALGVSRFLRLAHWLIQVYETSGAYLLLAGQRSSYTWYAASFFAELVHSFILADFCYYYIKSFMEKGQVLKNMPI